MRFSLFLLIISNLVVLCFLWLCFFFFFKQKTAYEMRISDWSSDVCSSDLVLLEIAADRIQPIAIALVLVDRFEIDAIAALPMAADDRIVHHDRIGERAGRRVAVLRARKAHAPPPHIGIEA